MVSLSIAATLRLNSQINSQISLLSLEMISYVTSASPSSRFKGRRRLVIKRKKGKIEI